ncbi:MAG: sulfotransferase [Verrucomicrobia bacterium]|nr:sulfotransferase [Verrucomicrobiota bacterium]
MAEATAPGNLYGRVVLIMGMHRSGTSLLAHMLAAAGLPFGTNLLNTPRPDNPNGYGEHAEVVAIHEELLEALGRTWYGPDGAIALPADWLSWPETLEAKERLTAIVRQELGARRLWALKDPRLCRLLPVWLALLDELRLEPVPVLCIRHPEAVAASLRVRNKMPHDHAVATWLAHMQDALRALDHLPASVVEFDKLLAAPEPVLRALLETLDVEITPEALAHAVALAKPEHRHHLGPQVPASVFGLSVSICERLYAALCTRSLPMPEDSGKAAAPLPLPPEPPDSTRTVTIVMCTRERTPFIPRAVRSVLAQTHRCWQLVVVNDGGAPEKVEQALAPYRRAIGQRLTVLHLERPVGVEPATNQAIAQARGDDIAVHADDDTWRPRFLEVCLAELAHPGHQGVVTASMLVHERTNQGILIELTREQFRPGMTVISLPDMLTENQFPPIAFVYTRRAWEEVGPYRTDLPVLGAWEFNLRFLARYPISFINEPLACRHLRPADDPYANPGQTLYPSITGQLRDQMLRVGGAVATAVLTGLGPLAQKLTRTAAAGITARVDEVLRHTDAGPLPVTPPANSRTTTLPIRLRLTPAGWSQVLDKGGRQEYAAYVSTGPDPQLLYALPGEPLPSGTYYASVQLTVPSGSGPVELFFSPGPEHAPERSIILKTDGRGAYTGVFTADEPLRHFRLDPMCRPGCFTVSPLVLYNQVPAPDVGRFPDFLCIGAQRSGTTWLHRNLGMHPELFLPPCKELHFFDDLAGMGCERWVRHRLHFLAEAQASMLADPADRGSAAWRRLEWAGRFATSRRVDATWYASLFEEAPCGVMAGEITPAYAVLPERAVAQATWLIPGLRVIFLMRDPIARALSGALHELTTATGKTTTPAIVEFERELDTERCRQRSAYRDTIERWERHLAPGSLGCFLFDDLLGNPSGLLRRICDFLGVSFNPAMFPEPAAPANANPTAPPQLPPALLRRLAERHLDDLAWLAGRFGGATLAWHERAERLRAGYACSS